MPIATQAATIWNGPLYTYNQPGTDPSQAANQDRLTDNVWLTRGPFQGMFNAVTESSYDKPFDTDPTDTEWSFGSLSDHASLHYTTWAAMSTNDPPYMVNQQAVVHLKSDDIYLSIMFTYWGGSSGGFAYQRSTPGSPPPPTPTVTITNLANGATFAAPLNLRIAANAAVSAGSVTNVQFFGNAASLGSAGTTPFSIIASNLSAGPYALTAVATAGGISATSAVVNITVVAPIAMTLTTPVITNGVFAFDYSANPGLSYVVQSSSNLTSWVSLATNMALSNPVHFTDSFVAGAPHYYRVGRLPNP